MIFDAISKILGIVKTIIYKLIYFRRIKLNGVPKVSSSIRYSIKKRSKLIMGKNFKARNNVSFRIYDGGKVIVGNNVFCNDNVSINCQKNISIGENTIIGPGVMIFDHDHDYKNDMNHYVKKDIVIGSNVWIGAGCIILKGIKIGNHAIIGAGTIVNKDVKANTLVFQKRNTESRDV